MSLPPSRDATVDALRGALLFTMGLNHIPSALRWLTDQPLGYVSSAEGFVFVSGLVAGMVYTRRMRSGAPVAQAAFARAVTLYRAHALTLLAVFAWTWLYFAAKGALPTGGQAPMLERPIAALLAGLTFLYQPGLLDILPMYCGCMLLLPLVLRQLERGRAPLVLASTLAWWALTNVFDGPEPYLRGIILSGAFHFGAWQLLFVLGAWFGHGWQSGTLRVPSARPLRLALVLACAGSLALARHGLIELPLAPETLRALTNKVNLAPLRLLNVALVFWLVRLALARLPAGLAALAPLARVGRQGLPVFCVHVVVAYVLLAFPRQFADTFAGRCLGPALLIAAMIAVAWQRERARRAGPVALAEPAPAIAPAE